ncbi:MAG: 50S ribosomal protein L20 [Deltaproteobacteria bacterium]|nr:50S ribosomal protein L20 [Deltaproteobacteria bacterium]
MAHVKRAQNRKTRKKNLYRSVKGYMKGRRRLRQATEAQMRSERYAFAGRKQRKRHFRALWIQRLSAAVRPHGLSYSQFVNGLKKAEIGLDRKQLAELALSDPATFAVVVERARAALT